MPSVLLSLGFNMNLCISDKANSYPSCTATSFLQENILSIIEFCGCIVFTSSQILVVTTPEIQKAV